MCKQNHEHQHCHHYHTGFLGKHTELYFAILSGIFLVATYALSFFEFFQHYLVVGYFLSFFFGSFFTIQEAFQKLYKGKFEIDFLMIVAACGAAYLGKWVEGALLLFLFSLGHALEHYALGRAQKAISALGSLTPDTALVKKGENFEEISIKDLKLGDVILVKVHEKIAIDGVVTTGKSSVNQAPITGESIPVDKSPMDKEVGVQTFENIPNAHRVFAGTINGASPLEIQVLRLAEDSTVARMIKMVSEAQAKQSPTQRFTKRIEKYYVPGVLILVLLLCFVFLLGVESFSESFYRAITVLVASSPCALAISTPGTVLSGIARGAQKGVLFKGGGALEDLGNVNAIAFDKTGTLTEGELEVVEVIAYNISKEKFLTLAISIETFSSHPLARAIVSHAKDLAAPATILKTSVNVIEGKGIEAIVGNEKLRLGKFSFLKVPLPTTLKESVRSFEKKGYTVAALSGETEFLGIIALIDKPKKNAATMLKNLRNMGIQKLVILTGDQKAVADTVGRELGIKEAIGDLLPEDKVEVVKDLNNRFGKTAMIGDGVNDAPAMATSTVGIAIGAAGSDVALETADIALLSDKIEQIPFAVGLSRKAKKIIQQNLFISLGSIMILIPMAILNVTGIGATIVLHEGTTILVILNALRLLSYRYTKKEYK